MIFRSLLFIFCFPLVLLAQESDTSRYMNLGISVGMPHQIAYPANNTSGYYLTNGPILHAKTYNFALSGQWFRPNRLGYGIELGFRRHFAAFRESQGQALFQGLYRGSFEAYSGYVAPFVLYNFTFDETNLLNLSAGIEVHAASAPSEYQYEQGTFFFDPSSGYALVRLGLEYRKRLIDNFSGSIYLNFTQGLDETATLSLAEDTGFTAEHLGSYWGTGFEFGVRVSMCWECRENTE